MMILRCVFVRAILVCSTVLLVFSPPLGSRGAFHLYYLTRMICVKFEDTLLRFANFIGVLWFKLILHHHESFGPSHCMSLSVPFPFPVLFLAQAWQCDVPSVDMADRSCSTWSPSIWTHIWLKNGEEESTLPCKNSHSINTSPLLWELSLCTWALHTSRGGRL